MTHAAALAALVAVTCSSLVACGGHVACEASSCGESDDALQGVQPGDSPDEVGDVQAPAAAQQAPQGAPTARVPCDFENPAWMGYAIPAADMWMGASDSTGRGLCEGWVRFKPDSFSVHWWDAATETKMTATANGSTWYGDDCGTAHCGTLTYGDGRVDLEMCTVHAFCDDGVARSVGYTW